jgi:hypothetical protein
MPLLVMGALRMLEQTSIVSGRSTQTAPSDPYF